MDRLSDRIAIVTGGAVGLGAVYSKALADEGATVILADIVDAKPVADEIRSRHGSSSAHVIETNVTDESQVQSLIEKTLAISGQIDIVINNAAMFASLPPAAVTDIDVDLWDRVMAVNVRGSFLLAKHVAPHMIKRQQGKIINIASGVAYKGMPNMLHYSASKGAVVTMTRSLARELGAHNICVNTLAPGLIMSDSIAANEEHIDDYRAPVIASRSIKRDGLPQDLVGALIFLSSPESDFMTGQTVAVDGGSINT
jgi:NAD(P)-dependent dehydrogenase (short-subunit alcohol dehydrogenase family)